MAMHVLPNTEAPRPDHHAAAHVRRLGQFGRTDHLLIPFGKVFVAPGSDSGFSSGGIHDEDVSQKRPTIVGWLCQPPTAIFMRNATAKCLDFSLGPLDVAVGKINRANIAIP